MKSYLLKEELSAQCKILSNHLANINTGNKDIPQIELDIFLRDIQDFYVKAVALKNANTSEPVKEEVGEMIVKQAEEIQVTEIEISSEIIVDEEKTNGIVEKEQVANVVSDDIVELAKSEDIVEDVVQPKEDKIELEEKQEIKGDVLENPSFNDLLEENPSRDDLFSTVNGNNETLDLNKKLAEARGNHSLAEKLQKQQIESLKAVIGVNDKFFFINELFDGDTSKYEDVIYTLNNFKKFDDAMQYFSTLKYRFNWKEESEAPEMLVKMLERKFNLEKA
ncbi:MAG: hypothetical protein KAH25_00030 [Bacteroidales bacterium]|nr:hypothetical protein [Bacteroidales bacterium]